MNIPKPIHLRYIQPADLPRLLRGVDSVEEKHRPLLTLGISLAAGAGLRWSEMAALQVRDIDYGRQCLLVPTLKRKRDKKGRPPVFEVFVSQSLMDTLRRWCRWRKPEDIIFADAGSRPCKRQCERLFKQAAVAAGLSPRLSWHSLRHCFAIGVHERGGDPYAIKAQLRHATLNMSCHYVHNTADDLKRLMG